MNESSAHDLQLIEQTLLADDPRFSARFRQATQEPDCVEATSVIRLRARARGLTVGERGRLSPQVLHAYATGHATPRSSTGPEPMKATTVAPGAGLRIGVSPAPGAKGNTRTISARAA